MRALIQLYPRAWRARYEDEMRDILEQHGTGWRTCLDLVRGAFDAHLTLRRNDMNQTALRRSLLLAVIPGALLAIGYALASPNLGIYPGFAGAAFAAWAAICLVAGGQAGRDDVPTRPAVMAGLLTGVAGALLALIVGVVGSVVQMAAFAGSGHFVGSFSASSMLVSQLGWPDAAIVAAAGLAGAVLGLAGPPLAQALARARRTGYPSALNP